jgi:hypothetical protein
MVVELCAGSMPRERMINGKMAPKTIDKKTMQTGGGRAGTGIRARMQTKIYIWSVGPVRQCLHHFIVSHVPKLTVMANVSSSGTANNAARTAPATPNKTDKANPMTISCSMVLRTLPSWMVPVAKPRMTLTLADERHTQTQNGERRVSECDKKRTYIGLSSRDDPWFVVVIATWYRTLIATIATSTDEHGKKLHNNDMLL